MNLTARLPPPPSCAPRRVQALDVARGLAGVVIAGHNVLTNIQPVTAATLLLALVYDSPFLYQPTPRLPVLAAYTILS